MVAASKCNYSDSMWIPIRATIASVQPKTVTRPAFKVGLVVEQLQTNLQLDNLPLPIDKSKPSMLCFAQATMTSATLLPSLLKISTHVQWGANPARTLQHRSTKFQREHTPALPIFAPFCNRKKLKSWQQ